MFIFLLFAHVLLYLSLHLTVFRDIFQICVGQSSRYMTHCRCCCIPSVSVKISCGSLAAALIWTSINRKEPEHTPTNKYSSINYPDSASNVIVYQITNDCSEFYPIQIFHHVAGTPCDDSMKEGISICSCTFVYTK